ncbi:MAG TPA: hypothetical protein VIQ24_02245 [Pyrinomonadaceae bacterium]
MKRFLTLLAIGLVTLAHTASSAGATENTFPITPVSATSTSLDCEGNACTQVTLTFDEAKQQYKVQNNSNRVVRVEGSDWAGGKSIAVEAGKTDYLPMKSFVGAYRANYE